MNTCRICLSTEISKSLKDVETADKSGLKNYIQILMFCFGIEVSEHSTVTNGLCMKCFKKIQSYYKFKILALTSDAYLRSLEPQIYIKNESSIVGDDDVAEFNNNDFNDDLAVKSEVEIKLEDNLNFESEDDEFLSVIKKCNEVIEDTQEEVIKVPYKKLKGNKQIQTTKKVKTKRLKKKYPNKRPGVCEECGKFVQNLTEHAITHISRENRTKIKCKFCDKQFTTKGAIYRHVRVKHKGIKKRCDICNKEVVCLRSHKLRIHQKELMPFPCVLCNQGCLTASSLESHMMIHTKDRPFECDVCLARFRVKSLMFRHKRQVHEGERSHMCQFCPKTFFKKTSLQDHLRTHTDERPYKCDKCGESFKTSTTLKNHRTIHSDNKPYHCPYCDLKFSRNSYLYLHKRTHSKEKNYPCKYCGVCFRRSDHRNRHEFTADEKLGQQRDVNGLGKSKPDDCLENEESNITEEPC